MTGGEAFHTIHNYIDTNEMILPFSEINLAYEDIPYCAEKKSEWQKRWTDLFMDAAE